MSQLAWISAIAWLVVIAAGGLFRSRAYALFRGVTLGLHTLIAVPLLPYAGALLPLALYLHALVYVDSLLLIRPTLRPHWFRLLVSWPAQFTAASTLLAFPWAIFVALGFHPWGVSLPFLIGLIGMVQSLTSRVETKDIVIGRVGGLAQVERVTNEHIPSATGARPLRVAQITDPHLGPFMSVTRLKKICQRVVDEDPDLVFLTGDFLTMESQGDERWLSEALSPLSALKGRVFACMGNHDHEAPRVVFSALASIGAELLIDRAALCTTAAGPVQIVGFDFHFRDRQNQLSRVDADNPRPDGALRLALLHDPGAFKHLAPSAFDLVLSGHTHGGQIGLLSIGLMWTIVGAVAKLPDHGLWGHGSSRLYVHRGTGHYGFPLRLGVPAEESILHLHIARD